MFESDQSHIIDTMIGRGEKLLNSVATANKHKNLNMSLVVRTGNKPESVSGAVHRIIYGLEPQSALILACLGMYGVLAFTVTGRTSEIRLRRALGARPECARSILGRAQEQRVIEPSRVV